MKYSKNIVVTGGNNGIGLQVVKKLYNQGHNIIFGSRNKDKNEQVIKKLSSQNKLKTNKLISYPLDLSSKKSVSDFASNILSVFPHIDILDNNAGVNLWNKTNNQRGIEMTLATNHFGHFYLTHLLWSAIKRSKQAKIINVSSKVHYYAPSRYLEDIECKTHTYIGMQQYSISKLYNILFTSGLNKLIVQQKIANVKVAAVDPGIVASGFYQTSTLLKLFKLLFSKLLFISEQEGSKSTLNLCQLPFAELKSGEYYDCDGKIKQMDKRGRNNEHVSKLWKISEQAYGIKFI